MNDSIIYIFIALIIFIAYKKYKQRKVLKIVPTLLSQGAQVIDVRSEAEFAFGHKDGSINIPLNSLKGRMNELDKTKPIILCCASGSRSAIAKYTLASGGFENIHNAGAWHSLSKVK